MIRGHHPALTGGQVFGRVKTEGGQVGQRAGLGPLILGPQGMGGVGYQGQVMASGDGPQGFVITGLPGIVHGNDGPGAGSDLGFHPGRVDEESVRFHVGEYRHAPLKHHGVGRGHKGHGGHDDLIPGPDAQDIDGRMQGRGAAGHGHPMPGPYVAGQRLFKFLHLGAGGQPAGAQNRHHLCNIFFVNPVAAIRNIGLFLICHDGFFEKFRVSS
jgi:hypothetical protein